jgi:hypothetical protein
MTRSRREIEALVEALDDVPVDEADAKATVKALGIDVGALAATIRAKIAAADAADRERRYHEARKAYADEVERLERRRIAPEADREALRATFRSLMARVPAETRASAHFHKYEAASDEELVELIRALRHLLGEDDPER